MTLGLFAVAVILCCCTQQATQIAKASIAVPSCHAHKQKTDAPVSKDCSCCTAKKLQADSDGKLVIQVLQFASTPIILAHTAAAQPFIKQQFNLAYLDGPPGLSSEIPLYLLFRSIRC